MLPSHPTTDMLDLIDDQYAPVLLGVRVDPLTTDELNARIGQVIDTGDRALVLNVNVHALNLAYDRPWLREFFNRAPIVFCDGAGVMLGARLLGMRIPQRITYADWMWQLAEFAEAHDYSLFLLGARPGVAEEAGRRLTARYPNLRIAGSMHGFFNKTAGHPDNETILAQINASAANILVVGFGMPLQEEWLAQNWDRLAVNIGLTGGAVFDYLSETLQRSPGWMNKRGLEWAGRLIIEPRRLWRRYLIGNPQFLWRILRQKYHAR